MQRGKDTVMTLAIKAEAEVSLKKSSKSINVK